MSWLNLEKKVAIVTGGASGIGKAVCEGFAEVGARTVIADVDQKGAEKLAAPFQEVFKRRCATCHEKMNLDQDNATNLTRPELSPVLLKPLAKGAGGYGMVKKVEKDGQETEQIVHVFDSTQDPDYQIMLDTIRHAKGHLDHILRFDMPSFRPNEHYIREMKSYGILPEDFGPEDPIDVYEIDEKYWRSHWYTTPSASR